jgi:hypothetical protein
LSRKGSGGHVTLYESTEGNNYKCRGGNQSDMVNVTNVAISSVVALVWPTAGGPVPPELAVGLTPEEAMWVQASLNLVMEANLDIDGIIGDQTPEALRKFQQS